MPELRKDPILERWVIIATERAKRPVNFTLKPEKPRGGFCPFCVGCEDKTPPEIFAFRKKESKPNMPGWSIRVIPNKFPVLRIEGTLDKQGDGVFDKMNGIGAHEVIIETPEHELTLSKLPQSQIEDLLKIFIARIIDLKKDERFKYILIFKNQGEAAGATMEHTHSQLIALPIIPINVLEEMAGSQEHFNYKERCIYCDIIRQESREQTRLIDENDNYIAISPFAPRFPFETWILPKKHISHFEELENNETELKALAFILLTTLKKIDIALNNAPYNFVIHTSPLKVEKNQHYHFHFEIIPKLTGLAGFEVGSGFYINPTSPEEACMFLKEIKVPG